MWGSDCPYQLENGNRYEDSISLVRERLNFISDTGKEWMLGQTAQKLYLNLIDDGDQAAPISSPITSVPSHVMAQMDISAWDSRG